MQSQLQALLSSYRHSRPGHSTKNSLLPFSHWLGFRPPRLPACFGAAQCSAAQAERGSNRSLSVLQPRTGPPPAREGSVRHSQGQPPGSPDRRPPEGALLRCSAHTASSCSEFHSALARLIFNPNSRCFAFIFFSSLGSRMLFLVEELL